MEPHAMADHYDVVIAGARCSGASTAMLLARSGLRVLVVDPLPRGRDTLSTHALMRGGVLQLHRWGLLDAIRSAGTPPVSMTTFDYGGETLSIAIEPRDGVDALYAPRRTVLDPVLANAAEAAGADVVHGLAVVDLLRDRTGRVRGAWVADSAQDRREVRADLVIGADGVRSRVARLVGASTEHEAKHTAACVYGYFTGLEDRTFLWAYRPGVSIGLIPTNDARTCVFACVPGHRFGSGRDGIEALFRQAVAAVDAELAAKLALQEPAGGLRAFAGIPGFLRRSAGPGWALVGDAGYFRDPITAHGITDALRDAELLARAVIRGDDRALSSYQTERDELARTLLDVTDRIASFDWSMDEIQSLHRSLSRAMKAGVDRVRAFDPDARDADPRFFFRAAG